MNEPKSIWEGLLEKVGLINHIVLLIWLVFEGVNHAGDVYDTICRYTTNPVAYILQLFSFSVIVVALFLILIVGIINLYKRFSKKQLHKTVLKCEEYLLSRKFRIVAIPIISFAIICGLTFTLINSRLDKRHWKLATTWPNSTEGYPSIMREDLVAFSNEVYEATKHKIRIDWDSSASENPSALFKSLQNGDIQMLSSVHYFWPTDVKNGSRAGDFFAAVPFGKEFEEFNDWIENDEGQRLWDSLCLKLNVKPFAFGHTGKQSGGWFVDSFSLESLHQLNMRIPTLQGEVIKKLGGQTVMVLPDKIKNYVEDDSLNAAEWICPYEDMVLRLHKIPKFKYYYLEGWHEEDAMLALYVNNDYFRRLDKDTKEILKQTIAKYNLKITAKFSGRNEWAMEELKKSRPSDLKVMDNIPSPLKDSLYSSWISVLKEHSKSDALFKRMYISYAKHHEKWIHKKGLFQKKNVKFNYAEPSIFNEVISK